ncbi:hypothetical protein C8Q77DRAFT_1162417 [Trametes polyzona]|nr:hypothetical protein C8Q77DRAFT_1162417 [Trametes polyzona]
MPNYVIPHAKIDLSHYRPRSQPRGQVPLISFPFAGETCAPLSALLSTPLHVLQQKMPAFGDKSIQATGLPAIFLKFCWPGYEKYDLVEVIHIAGRTDGQIAVGIAMAMQTFILKAMQLVPTDPRYAIIPGSPLCNLNYLGIRSLIQVHADLFIVQLEVNTSRVPTIA